MFGSTTRCKIAVKVEKFVCRFFALFIDGFKWVNIRNGKVVLEIFPSLSMMPLPPNKQQIQPKWNRTKATRQIFSR